MSLRRWTKTPRQFLRRVKPQCCRCSCLDDEPVPGAREEAGPGDTPLLPPGGAGEVDDSGGNDVGFGGNAAVPMATEKFLEIQRRCLREKVLYEDPDFKPGQDKLYQDGRLQGVQWQRPKEITPNAVFFHDGSKYYDFEQGDLGNCWFVASVACLASSPQKQLLARVVPKDQSFSKNYCGVFRFMFWQYGEWVEVIVDDRLPTWRDELMYGQNKTHPNEYWCPLLEKAYAKLNGNYHNIDGGRTMDGLVDMTGGLGELVPLKGRLPMHKFKKLLLGTKKMNSIVAGAIHQIERAATRETLLKNGLYAGHAYSVIGVKEVLDGEGGKVVLLHLRNPWGKGEWKGKWSDGSKEWKTLSDIDRRASTRMREEGEFWISMEDFSANFDEIEFCHLTPDAVSDEIADNLNLSKWQKTEYHGAWVRGVSAGGYARSFTSKKFWSNPQYKISLANKTEASSVVVQLMRRETNPPSQISIGFLIFKLSEGDKPHRLTADNFYVYTPRLTETSNSFWPYRERTLRFDLEAADYVVVPMTYRPDKEAEFYLRIFCEMPLTSSVPDNPISAADEDIPPTPMTKGGTNYINPRPKVSEEQIALEEFDILADQSENGTVWADGLVKVFQAAFALDDRLDGFNMETCRCLINVVNRVSRFGDVTRKEFQHIWNTVYLWRNAFENIDVDNNGSLDATELITLFYALDFGDFSKEAIEALLTRYGGQNGKVKEEDFIQGFSRTLAMFKTHRELEDAGKISVGLGEWISIGMTC